MGLDVISSSTRALRHNFLDAGDEEPSIESLPAFEVAAIPSLYRDSLHRLIIDDLAPVRYV